MDRGAPKPPKAPEDNFCAEDDDGVDPSSLSASIVVPDPESTETVCVCSLPDALLCQTPRAQKLFVSVRCQTHCQRLLQQQEATLGHIKIISKGLNSDLIIECCPLSETLIACALLPNVLQAIDCCS